MGSRVARQGQWRAALANPAGGCGLALVLLADLQGSGEELAGRSETDCPALLSISSFLKETPRELQPQH